MHIALRSLFQDVTPWVCTTFSSVLEKYTASIWRNAQKTKAVVFSEISVNFVTIHGVTPDKTVGLTLRHRHHTSKLCKIMSFLRKGSTVWRHNGNKILWRSTRSVVQHCYVPMAYLLLSYVDRFVEDDPRDRLMTGWHCCWSVIRHIIICFRQQASYGQSFHLHFLSCQIENDS